MQNCPKCGFKISDNSESCDKCGVIFSKMSDITHKDISYGLAEAMPSRPSNIQRNTKIRNMLIACIVILFIVFQVQKFRTAQKLTRKPKLTISDDGYSRIITEIDDYGHVQVTTEPLVRPVNEKERNAIARRNNR